MAQTGLLHQTGNVACRCLALAELVVRVRPLDESQNLDLTQLYVGQICQDEQTQRVNAAFPFLTCCYRGMLVVGCRGMRCNCWKVAKSCSSIFCHAAPLSLADAVG